MPSPHLQKSSPHFPRIRCHKRHKHAPQADGSFEAFPIGIAEAGSWR
jgi:hypothetical protein